MRKFFLKKIQRFVDGRFEKAGKAGRFGAGGSASRTGREVGQVERLGNRIFFWF
jgi:hypothetical protein